MEKEQKSFNTLLQEMSKLSEDRLGNLKGGIAVISSISSSLESNSGTCVNNGDCSKEENTSMCFNNKGTCPPRTLNG